MSRLLNIYLINVLIVVGFSSCSNDSNKKEWTNKEALIKALEWQEQHPIFALAPTDWTNGAYYIGVTKAYQATQDPIFLAALKTMGYRNEWKPHSRTYHADDIAISYPYLFTSTTRRNLVDIEPTKTWIDTHLFEPNQWTEGNHPVRQILWWWCDALFMAPPVITYYSTLTGDQKYLDSMHKHFMETYDLLFDKEEDLFARDVRFKITGNKGDLLEDNGEKIFWSRGNGWVLGGLVLILELMPKDFEHYQFYVDLYKTMARRIKNLQPDDGLWRVSLLYPEGYSHGEVSGSGFFTYALAWGINNGLLNNDEYKPSVMKAWEALRECQHEDGMVGWVQNIGDSPKPADKDSWQNYGTGAFLLAGSEVITLPGN